VTRWHPCLELERFLEAMSEDVIATTDDELRQMQGLRMKSSVREVRHIIDAARVETSDGGKAILDDGMRTPATRSQLARPLQWPVPPQRH
jgi:hypothetical protein